MLKVARKGEERGLLYALRFAEQERDEALVRVAALRLGVDKELEDESVERYRATRGILFQAGDKSTTPLTAALSDQVVAPSAEQELRLARSQLAECHKEIFKLRESLVSASTPVRSS